MAALEGFFKNGLVWLAEEPAPSLQPPQSPSQGISIPQCPAPLSRPAAQFGIDSIDSQLPLGGLPSAAVHEWAATEDLSPCSILALLAGNVLRKTLSHTEDSRTQASAKKFVVWIGRDIWPTPYLLEQTMYVTFQEGSSSSSKSLLSHCLFIDPPQEKLKLWAIELALRSPVVAAVVADCKKLSFATSRKFSLAARQSGALGLLIRDEKGLRTPSAATSRWRIQPAISASSFPCLQLELLKCKGAQPKLNSWVVELREGLCAYEPNQQTLSLHLSSLLGRQSSPDTVAENTKSPSSRSHPTRQQERQSASR